MTAAFTIQYISCIFLCGLIWIIQLVHYPAFKYVDSSNFVKFEKFHTQQISLIVIPVMLLELVTAVQLVFINGSLIMKLNLLLALAIWTVTFIYSAPCHVKLSKGKNEKIIDLLIKTNWLRTFLWSFKALLLTYMMLQIQY